MQINKTFFNSATGLNYKKDEEEKIEKKKENIKEGEKGDRIEITGYIPEELSLEAKAENSTENSYIQLKYAGYKIKESADEAMGLYEGLSKERVYGLL